MLSTRTTALSMAALLATTGVLHLVTPQPFVAIVPRSLPQPQRLVALSGAAEIACAAALVAPATRRLGGWLSAVTFVAVFPANVSMALRSGRRPAWYQIAAWARLPLQIPLVGAAVRVARTPRRPG